MPTDFTARSDASEAKSLARKAMNMSKTNGLPIFLDIEDFNLDKESTGLFSSKEVLNPNGRHLVNISNIKEVTDYETDQKAPYTKIKTYVGSDYFVKETVYEIKQMIEKATRNFFGDK